METLPKTLFAFFWHFIKKQWKLFALIQIFSFAWSLDHTLWPYVLMLVIDGITQFSGDKANLWVVLAYPIIFGISLWAGVEVFFRAGGFLLAKAIPRLEASVRMEMFDYVQHHSHLYFSNNMAGTLSNKISDMSRSLSYVIQQVICVFIPVLAAMLTAMIMFFYINSYFAMILGGWLLVHISICLFFSKRCDYYSDIHADSRSNLSGKIVDSLTNHINVKLFSRHRFEYQNLLVAQKEEQEKNYQALYYMEKMKAVLGLVAFLGVGLGINWYMLYSWQQNWITTGEVVFIFNTTWNITMMAWVAGLQFPLLFKEIGVCRQALSIVQDPHDVKDLPQAKPLITQQGHVAFEKVSFSYNPNQRIFQDKNVQIRGGEKVGLVGFSGSGKTTFVNLMLRYYDLHHGRILIDGQDISQVTQASLREQIAVIPQDASLFHRTLMENIRYGSLHATDEEVIEASKKAHCHEFIAQMPQGYHTLVGERGIKLSGGQRQRIAIARAILKNAPLLILDEATSALDSVTEKLIQQSLRYLMSGRTTIVIAHRLSTLSGMDRILVFKEGRIIEEGDHQDLLLQNGHYANMWNMQVGGFLPEKLENES